jgi:hypothetical protein
MSYREILLKQIAELEKKIESDSAEREILQKELQRLKRAEFEEDIRESNERRLLQEGC